jgi:excisionase family DNA binding protein
VPGHLTVTQLAKRLGVTKHWLYDRIHNGTVTVTRDAGSGLYLFPDTPETVHALEQLKAGELERLAIDPQTAC